MKKSVILISLVLMIFIVLSASAQEGQTFENPTYTQEFIEQQESLLNNLDSLFPRTLLKYTYEEGTAISDDAEQFEGFTFKSVKKDGRNEITITADEVSETEEYSRGW